MTNVFYKRVLGIILSISVFSAMADPLVDKINHALDFAEVQLEKHAQRKGPLRYTCYTDTAGKWIDTGMEAWCSGFSGGLMWMMFDHTEEQKWADYGRDWMIPYALVPLPLIKTQVFRYLTLLLMQCVTLQNPI